MVKDGDVRGSSVFDYGVVGCAEHRQTFFKPISIHKYLFLSIIVDDNTAGDGHSRR